MKIAIEGCCHGALDAIYKHIGELEAKHRYKVDLLLICGDFQAVRNHQDLQCMSVPNKYKSLGGFYRYYSGKAQAPILTICIGGNHEASNYFHELYHGGWIAPNIYYLGHAGCVQINGIRIAGMSGIYKHHDFKLGQYERLPYGPDAIRSIYHVREYNVRRLSLLSSPDIFLSHDWPRSIERYGDVEGLLRHKKHFRDDIERGVFGSPPLMGLLTTLQPRWWFSAHMHTKFEATVNHDIPASNVPIGNPDEIAIDDFDDENSSVRNPDEIAIDDFDDENSSVRNPDEIAIDNIDEVKPSVRNPDVIAIDNTDEVKLSKQNPDEITLSDEEQDVSFQRVAAPKGTMKETKFLALDKCLPNRRFLEIIDYPAPIDSQPLTINLDPEWLAITKAFHPFLSTTRTQSVYPTEENARELVKKASEWVKENVSEIKPVEQVQQFMMTAPEETDEQQKIDYRKVKQPKWYPNPQTEAFCKLLNIKNNVC